MMPRAATSGPMHARVDGKGFPSRDPRQGGAADDGRAVHHPRARCRARRPARAPRPHPPARPGSRGALDLRHRRDLPRRPDRLLARRVRLARAGSRAQRLSANHSPHRRDRPPLPACAGTGAEPAPTPPLPRLAGLGVRVPRSHPAPDRPGPLRRPAGGRLHGGGALASWLRPVVPPGPAAPRRRGDRRPFFGVDDAAGLRALHGAGGRLGRLHHHAARLALPRTGRGPAPQHAAGAPRPLGPRRDAGGSRA